MAGQRVDVALVDVAEHGEAPDRVSVQRAVADRELALVAGREHEPVLRVRDRHERGPADPRLDVLLGESVVFLLAEEAPEYPEVGFVERGDIHRTKLDPQAIRQGGGVTEAVFRGEGAGHRHPAHSLDPQCFDGQVCGDRRVDSPRQADDGARWKILLEEIIADAQNQPGLELPDRIAFLL